MHLLTTNAKNIGLNNRNLSVASGHDADHPFTKEEAEAYLRYAIPASDSEDGIATPAKGTEEGMIHDLSGRRVTKSDILSHGIYIQDGKKIVK